MYNADSVLRERFGVRLQTKANNNDPRVLAYAMRNRTAISTQKFWEKQLITSTVGTRSSIAVTLTYTPDVIAKNANKVMHNMSATIGFGEYTPS